MGRKRMLSWVSKQMAPLAPRLRPELLVATDLFILITLLTDSRQKNWIFDLSYVILFSILTM